MKVKAAPGLKCPMEGKPKEYISDDPKGVDVADTAYYRRLVEDGSLELVPDAAPAKGSAQAKKDGGDQ